MAITDATHVLEFLDAKEIAQLLHARKDAAQDHAAVWHWIATRMRQHLPGVALPQRNLRESSHDTAVLVALLRRLHVVMTYAFDLRFDATRLGRDVRIADDEQYVTNWGLTGGSIFGDRPCVPDAVSYWECEGLSDGSYVGIADESNRMSAFSFGARFQQSTRQLSLATPACDNMPAIMYCESGFITNGAFRGPRPPLPAGVAILHAQPYAEHDRVGVLVDLLEGTLVFLLNGVVQGVPIPLDRTKQYRPVFTARMCYNLRLIPRAVPPWRSIYDVASDALAKSDDDPGASDNNNAEDARDSHAIATRLRHEPSNQDEID